MAANDTLLFHAVCVGCSERWTFEKPDDIIRFIEEHDCGNDLSEKLV